MLNFGEQNEKLVKFGDTCKVLEFMKRWEEKWGRIITLYKIVGFNLKN